MTLSSPVTMQPRRYARPSRSWSARCHEGGDDEGHSRCHAGRARCEVSKACEGKFVAMRRVGRAHGGSTKAGRHGAWLKDAMSQGNLGLASFAIDINR